MRRLVIISLLSAAAIAVESCASVPSSSPADVLETVRISGTAGTMQVNTATSTTPTSIALGAPLATLWALLPGVYDSLGIPVNAADNGSHTLGNSGFKLRRQLGRVALSRYINCGNTQGPPSADTYEVQLTVLTQLSPDVPSGTVISTTVQAAARPITVSAEFSRCASTGALETAIAGALRARL